MGIDEIQDDQEFIISEQRHKELKSLLKGIKDQLASGRSDMKFPDFSKLEGLIADLPNKLKEKDDNNEDALLLSEFRAIGKEITDCIYDLKTTIENREVIDEFEIQRDKWSRELTIVKIKYKNGK